MTQDPFPTDNHHTNVMRIREHPKFTVAVDKFSVKGLASYAGPRTAACPSSCKDTLKIEIERKNVVSGVI